MHDAIHVKLGGVTLVAVDDCVPKEHAGIVFYVAPIHLPKGFYEFSYTIRTTQRLAYIMASVLPGTVDLQPKGLMSYSDRSLYLPASVSNLTADVERFSGQLSSNATVRVVPIT
jgi:hypothetical protein